MAPEHSPEENARTHLSRRASAQRRHKIVMSQFSSAPEALPDLTRASAESGERHVALAGATRLFYVDAHDYSVAVLTPGRYKTRLTTKPTRQIKM